MNIIMIKKILIRSCFAILALVLLGVSYQYISTKIDDYRFPAPGKLIDIGDHKLHIHCTGDGEPTVILDAGTGFYSIFWMPVQKEIQKITHVCSYDRAGYGWSEPSSKPRTSATIVDELHTLLEKIHAQPPYILVGHSSGGINMRLYANTYPNEVFGVILVDSSYEKQIERFAEVKKQFPQPQTEPTFMEQLHRLIFNNKAANYLGLNRLRYAFGEKDQHAPEVFEIFIAKKSAFKPSNSGQGEPESFKESLKQVEQSINSLENKALIVISAGKKDEAILNEQARDARAKAWLACQQDLVNLSKKSQWLIAEKSGHMIPIEQPEIIVDAIRTMVEQFKKAKDSN